ncbi:MAG: hypothetical protein EBV38_04040 [Burkholderiaceae bacterium]|nr:hypothetical protein [Burkholderiaceae bacterium]
MQWSINGEKVADINIRTETDRVILNYRSRSNGGEWQPMDYPVTLEWTPCNLGGRRHRSKVVDEPDEPKGMHWHTFERMKAEHDAFANASWAGVAERLGLMNPRLVGLGRDG